MTEIDKNSLDLNALGNAIDTTFGRSSTLGVPTQSIKYKVLSNEKIEATFNAIVNLVNDKEMIDLRKRYTDEAKDTIAASVKRVKETYKDLTDGETIKFKQISESDSFEIINLNIYNRKRTAYFRFKVIFEIK